MGMSEILGQNCNSLPFSLQLVKFIPNFTPAHTITYTKRTTLMMEAWNPAISKMGSQKKEAILQAKWAVNFVKKAKWAKNEL